MKVMVIDTVGGNRFSDSYKSYFPNVKLRGIEMRDDGECHPHGYQCGYYAGVLLNAVEGEHELVFVRIFDEYAQPIVGSNEWILDVIASEKPNIVTRSWGQHDQDNKWGQLYGEVAWSEWCKKFVELHHSVGFVDFGAAGNSDSNDADTDIDYPHRLIPYVCNIIGSHNRAGMPSVFSGDGVGVGCTMWGENVYLNSNGVWERGSGTSFACPKAAGLCAALNIKSADWGSYVMRNATRPENWMGYLPNKKWGWGSLEYRYQEHLSLLPDNLLPPRLAAMASQVTYKDYQAHRE